MNEELQIKDGSCSVCHRPIRHQRLSLKYLIQDAFSNIFNLDRGLLYTVVALWKDPSAVVRAFIEGERYQYMNPFRFLVMVATLAVIVESFANTTEMASVLQIEGANEESNKAIGNLVKDYLNVVMMASVPIFSIGSFFAFKRQKWNLAEHLVVNAYSYAFVALAGTILSIIALVFPVEIRAILEASSQLLVFYIAYVYIKTWNLHWLKGMLGFFLTILISLILIIVTILPIGVLYKIYLS